jgi:hypothetical protein
MAHPSARSFVSIIVAILLLASPSLSFAFQSPLSEESIREAYFLGQRHDETFARTLDKYTLHLDPPKTGPYISSVTFFTPFALAVQSSSQHTSGYSAQQAQIDHRNQEESVIVLVQIQFTDSYGALIPRPTSSRSNSPTGFALRPYDFWKDFQVEVSSEDKLIRPFSSSGDPNYVCSDNGGCTLTGATLQFEFLASVFTSDSANIFVTPPEGDPVSVDFDLTTLR